MRHLPNVDQLSFHQTHTISIFKVDIDNFTLYDGELSISPHKITLRILGKINPLPHPKKHPENEIYHQLKKLICEEQNYLIYLFDLKCTTSVSGPIKRLKNTYKFKAEYDISFFYVVLKNCSDYRLKKANGELFKSIKIHSPEIVEWLGITNRQQSLIKNSISRNPKDFNFKDTIELPINLSDIAKSFFIYDIHYFTSFTDHKVGFGFPPYLVIKFSESQSIETVTDYIQSILCIYYFLARKNISTEKIILTTDRGSSKPHIYFHRNERSSLEPINDCSIIFNYGINVLKDSEEEVADFYRNVFHSFFTLQEENKKLFRLFINLQSTTDIFDKFIGYFRIVEQLTLSSETYCDKTIFEEHVETLRENLIKAGCTTKNVKALCGRILKLNYGKVDTRTRFDKALSSFPELLREFTAHWRDKLEKIVTLRNNISHGNVYLEDEQTIMKYALLLELISHHLLWDLIGLTKHKNANQIVNFSKYWPLYSNESSGKELGKKIAEIKHDKCE
jgi:hypothetical protein